MVEQPGPAARRPPAAGMRWVGGFGAAFAAITVADALDARYGPAGGTLGRQVGDAAGWLGSAALLGVGAASAVLVGRLRMLAGMARARGKLAALTETGVETVPDPGWWTGGLLPALKAPEIGGGIAYALVWRNSNDATDRRNHFYAPYPGQASAADFLRFKQDPFVLFEDELPNLYRLPRR